jgi:hypothetical protein
MKKTLLGLAVIAVLTLVSCKQDTKDKVEATDAIGAKWTKRWTQLLLR